MCRDFLAEPVADDVLRRVLAAAFRGPSAGNTHALDLVVLRGDATVRHWDLTLPPERRADFAWPGLLRAPVLVEVVVDPAAYVERYGRRDKAASGLGAGESAWDVPYWFVDGGAAVMAMLLAAEAEGLGALLFGLFDHERAVLDALGVPAGRRAVGTVALGWPAPGGRRPSRSARRGRPSPDERVHLGAW
jgi:nitroreductase